MLLRRDDLARFLMDRMLLIDADRCCRRPPSDVDWHGVGAGLVVFDVVEEEFAGACDDRRDRDLRFGEDVEVGTRTGGTDDSPVDLRDLFEEDRDNPTDGRERDLEWVELPPVGLALRDILFLEVPLSSASFKLIVPISGLWSFASTWSIFPATAAFPLSEFSVARLTCCRFECFLLAMRAAFSGFDAESILLGDLGAWSFADLKESTDLSFGLTGPFVASCWAMGSELDGAQERLMDLVFL